MTHIRSRSASEVELAIHRDLRGSLWHVKKSENVLLVPWLHHRAVGLHVPETRQKREEVRGESLAIGGQLFVVADSGHVVQTVACNV